MFWNKGQSKAQKYKNYVSPQFQSQSHLQPNSTLSEIKTSEPKEIYLKHLKSSSNFKVYRPLSLQTSVVQSQQSFIRIRLLTFNVWFQHNNEENRVPCLIQLMKDSNADFICLQEVTKNFMEEIQKSGLFKDYRTVFVEFHNWYETAILSKYQCRVIKKPFRQTAMGRSMLLAETVLENGENIIVGSMHFESLDSEKIRKAQMTQTFEACRHCPNVVIAGDFNFSDGFPQNELIAANGYRDLWLQGLKQQERSFSMPESYTMPKTKRFSAWRPDHIIYKVSEKSQSFFGSRSRIKKVGDFTIPPFQQDSPGQISQDGFVRTPSDHLGLFSELFFLTESYKGDHPSEKQENNQGFFQKINIFKKH